MKYNPIADTVVSVDKGGMMEYWVPDLDVESGFEGTENSKFVSWKFKSDTDLYEFKKVIDYSTILLHSIHPIMPIDINILYADQKSPHVSQLFTRLYTVRDFWIRR
jgi:hypothetical protein